MELIRDKQKCKQAISSTLSLISTYEQEVEDLQLKLKYREALFYEVEKKLSQKQRFLQSLRDFLPEIQKHVESLGDEKESLPIPQSPRQERVQQPRAMNLSEEERERRRNRMKEIWARRASRPTQAIHPVMKFEDTE